MPAMNAKWLAVLITRFASRLRFPQLFLLTAGLFLVDLVVPDFLPFADEILLALATLLLGTWQRERNEVNEAAGDDARFAKARRVGPANGRGAPSMDRNSSS